MINMSPPAECWGCKQIKPQVGSINIMMAAAGGTPSVFKPVCAECWEKNHDPFATMGREITRLRAELATTKAYVDRLHAEVSGLRVVNDNRNETIKRLETETHALVAELATLRAPATDEAMVEEAVARAITQTIAGGSFLVARAVVAVVTPMIEARERDRCAKVCIRIAEACEDKAAARLCAATIRGATGGPA